MDLLKPGQLFQERYLINEKIGSGGMGTVYKATQTDINSQVAIKILNPSYLSSKAQQERFLREFRILARLSHEHIVSFYNAAMSTEAIPYAVFEYIDGITLAKLLQIESRLSWQRTLFIMRQVCEAIDAAHEIGVIHRDLKPENIMLLSRPNNDFVKVVDFGLARAETQEEVQKLTNTGELIGSIHYMSPEQCSGQQVDLRSDIYSIACIIYQCLTGELLFDADTPIGILHLHAKSDATARLKHLEGLCPELLIEVLAKMLDKYPEKRYDSIKDLMTELTRISDDDTITITKPLLSGNTGNKARFDTLNPSLLVAVFAPILFFFVWLLFTDEGILLQADLSLASNQSKSNLLYWLERANKLSQDGQIRSSKELESKLRTTISSKTKSPLDAANLYLELASKSKEESESINLAIEALEQITKLDAKKQEERAKLIKEAVQRIKRYSIKLTVPQIKQINKINGNLVSTEIYDLIYPELSKRNLRLDSTFLSALTSRHKADAKAGRWEDVETSLPMMETSLNNAWGEFAIADYELSAAKLLIESKNKASEKLVRSLLKRSIEIMKKSDGEEFEYALWEPWLSAMDSYTQIGDYSHMIYCAQNAFRIAGLVHDSARTKKASERIGKAAESIALRMDDSNKDSINPILVKSLDLLELGLPSSLPYYEQLANKSLSANQAIKNKSQAKLFGKKISQLPKQAKTTAKKK